MQYIVLKFCKKITGTPQKARDTYIIIKSLGTLKSLKTLRSLRIFGIRWLPYLSARSDLDDFFFFLSASIFLTYGSDLISATRSVMYLRRSSQR